MPAIPYKIDTLFMYMANMAWNSSMNPGRGGAHDGRQGSATGGYRIPHIIYSDAFYSETVAYADLVLPDTTYLERWDCISLLDRPIGSPEGPADSIRQPVLPPDRDVRPFQDVLIDLGARLKLPGFVKEDGSALYRQLRRLHRQPRTPPRRRPARRLPRRRRQRRGRRRAQPRPVAALRRQRLLLAVPPRARGALLQARQRRVSGRRQAAGPDRQHRADRAAALLRAAAEIPPRRRGPRRRSSRPTAQRERMRTLFRPAADLVSAVRASAAGTGGVSAARDHPAADGDVPFVGLAECLAAADLQPQPARTCTAAPPPRWASRTTAGSG